MVARVVVVLTILVVVLVTLVTLATATISVISVEAVGEGVSPLATPVTVTTVVLAGAVFEAVRVSIEMV